ncbi:unnamed protein product [Rhizoctonia solani]|uniref:Uncharacterized protein n=1 Tax=Rhizoctonia solani TaxID=456999 RepID=A0A8H2WAP1_9AGAM|nr:unnamed protein product [Rhizoctonia solani]
MLTGIEIVALAMASTGMSGSVASKIANYTRKGAAQKVYDDVIHQYNQVKVFRKDEAVSKFLTEKDKEELDTSIKDVTFDLMELHSILQDLKGVAYYKITAYGAKWLYFHDHVQLTMKLIVDVNAEIKERSAHGRSQARSESMREEQADFLGVGASPCGNENVAVRQGLGSGDCEILSPTQGSNLTSKIALNRQIADEMASLATATLRASIAGGMKSWPLLPAEDSEVHAAGESKSTIENVPPKATSAPPSLDHGNDIEMKKWEKEVD